MWKSVWKSGLISISCIFVKMSNVYRAACHSVSSAPLRSRCCWCLPAGPVVSSGRSWAELVWSSGCSGAFSSAWGWLRMGPLSERWPGSSAASPPEEHTHRATETTAANHDTTHTRTYCTRSTGSNPISWGKPPPQILSFKNCCCKPPHTGPDTTCLKHHAAIHHILLWFLCYNKIKLKA